MTVKEYFSKIAPTMDNIQSYLRQSRSIIINTSNNKTYLSDNCKLMNNKESGITEIIVIHDALLIGSNQIIGEILIRWNYVVSIEEYNTEVFKQEVVNK